MTTFDFSGIKPPKQEVAPVDPIELFIKVKVTDPAINDLWLAQGDALREWHKNRSRGDIGLVLNTGAGKTLVGLLMAQSLVNETKGKVIYVCSSIQLVEQTAGKAKGYGLQCTTYFRGGFSNDLYSRGKAPCITTYQAVFRGGSKFAREDVDAVIFDDAHAAEHIIRDHFSLKIDRKENAALYSTLIALFREYFYNIGKSGTFEELATPGCQKLLFVPPFEVHRQFSEIVRVLTSAKLSSNIETAFPWEYLRDRIDLCAFVISGGSLTITPPFIPIRQLPYFRKEVRRIYLSATLGAPDAFTRTFGKVPEIIIAPETKAGKCERLILFPSNVDENDVAVAKEAIKGRKTLILVPTRKRSKLWDDIAYIPEQEKVTESVDMFKKDSSTPKLVLAARYDGVDLPGDTCRVMVIDDLPTGLGHLERYMWESLNLNKTLRSTVASRIIQSFGRISRGLSDHGGVLITGKKLVDWLLTPKNQAYLPRFLTMQIMLGQEVSKNLKKAEDVDSALTGCLGRSEGWLKAYEQFMNTDVELNGVDSEEESVAIASAEVTFGAMMWDRNYAGAAKVFAESLESTFAVSSNTGAWHSLWLGMAYELMGDSERATGMYSKAHQVQKNIPQICTFAKAMSGKAFTDQVIEVASQFKINEEGKISLPKTIASDLSALDGAGTSSQTEEALRALGQYLGLQALRPDNECNTGPDVLWLLPGCPALCMEVKTDKKETSNYTKGDIGQMNDHLQWVYDNTESKDVRLLFVGPISPATHAANPSQFVYVCQLEEFLILGKRLIAALEDVKNYALPLTLPQCVQDVFAARNLLWPDCLGSFKVYKLKDIK
ncbi:DEAD/DEAH box helicase [Geomonas terrae]|uniref:DEAD/DEAH box helicase n=1 Tax=Geomonas terrae TaxID=2562681 RepID=A0A4S1CDX1_9BACT|nr:DEAD/DEAH box helicase family protein [Geomonas terrae]TGU71627.1 DEAD/DEAH box helicase [Geomonas terrae]